MMSKYIIFHRSDKNNANILSIIGVFLSIIGAFLSIIGAFLSIIGALSGN